MMVVYMQQNQIVADPLHSSPATELRPRFCNCKNDAVLLLSCCRSCVCPGQYCRVLIALSFQHTQHAELIPNYREHQGTEINNIEFQSANCINLSLYNLARAMRKD